MKIIIIVNILHMDHGIMAMEVDMDMDGHLMVGMVKALANLMVLMVHLQKNNLLNNQVRKGNLMICLFMILILDTIINLDRIKAEKIIKSLRKKLLKVILLFLIFIYMDLKFIKVISNI